MLWNPSVQSHDGKGTRPGPQSCRLGVSVRCLHAAGRKQRMHMCVHTGIYMIVRVLCGCKRMQACMWGVHVVQGREWMFVHIDVSTHIST